MNKAESKYFNTAVRMNNALLELLERKDLEYITVKEICNRAGVNRSTFYLHYGTVGDLLDETTEYINRQFRSYFSGESEFQPDQIRTADLDTLYLITPRYLLPYLQYIKDHHRLYRAVIEKGDLLGSKNNFDRLLQYIMCPIMDRYHISEEKQPYVIRFHIEGIIGIIKHWIQDECRQSIEFICEIITTCVRPQ